MNNLRLKKQIFNKISEIYPGFKKDAVLLFGSRALGWEVDDSDIDIVIFTDNTDYYRAISVKNGFRKRDEDIGFEIPLDDKILLEVKIHSYKIPPLGIIWVNDLIKSKILIPNERFSKYKKAVLKQFSTNYNNILMKAYIHFYNEFKQMEGMSRRQDELSKTNFFIKKGIVLQAFLRLILVMQKKPYPCDKWLSHFVSKTKCYPAIKEFISEFDKVESYEDVDKWKKKVRNFIDPRMPNKPYVGSWWKYLKEFSELK